MMIVVRKERKTCSPELKNKPWLRVFNTSTGSSVGSATPTSFVSGSLLLYFLKLYWFVLDTYPIFIRTLSLSPVSNLPEFIVSIFLQRHTNIFLTLWNLTIHLPYMFLFVLQYSWQRLYSTSTKFRIEMSAWIDIENSIPDYPT